MTTFPLSVNKIKLDHLRYEPHDTYKVRKNIKLNVFKTLKWVTFLLCVSQFAEWVYFFNQIKCPKFKLHTDALESSKGPPIGGSPKIYVWQTLINCSNLFVVIQYGSKSSSCMDFNHSLFSLPNRIKYYKGPLRILLEI